MERLSGTPTRRGIAAAVSGVLVSGAIAGALVGAAGPASATLVPVAKDFTAVCKVRAGGLSLGEHDIRTELATEVDVPLKPGKKQPAHDVSVTLTMPRSLQKATTSVLGITHAKGRSPDSAVDVTLPLAAELGGGEETKRIPLKGLSAPKARVPKKRKWKITSTGIVPAVDIPGFAGRTDDLTATFALAPKFTIKATLFAKNGKKFRSTMKCTVPKDDRPINDAVPIDDAHKADTVDGIHKGVRFEKSAKVQLVFFNPGLPGAGPKADDTFTQPKHGSIELAPTGIATYTPDKNYAGPDSFTYTAAKDGTNPEGSTSTVTLKVKKAPSTLTYRAPRRIRFGEVARVRAKVTSEGIRRGPIRLTKGDRVLDKGVVSDGRAMLRIERRALKIGEHTLRIRYAGSDTVRPATAKLTLRVLKRR